VAKRKRTTRAPRKAAGPKRGKRTAKRASAGPGKSTDAPAAKAGRKRKRKEQPEAGPEAGSKPKAARKARRKAAARSRPKASPVAASASPPSNGSARAAARTAAPGAAPGAAPAAATATAVERIERLSPLRRRIGERLVAAQSQAALLTTFNEVDLGNVRELRQDNQELFRSRYGVKLGLMSFFVRATVRALRLVPELNAELRGEDLVYRDRYDVGVAVGGGEGLVVPVLHDAGSMGFAEIERAIADYADRAQAGELSLQDLTGGTFTISNGGVYGSLLSTPIVNPPQSGILGLHAIQDRPVVREGAIVVRPMMYVALTYDHRVVDGRQAVGFLRHVKEAVEDPMLHLM
jgi:2-oxoglutarate dehydrogenase E2 component (dihydrolipoamide succinyltransferase)